MFCNNRLSIVAPRYAVFFNGSIEAYNFIEKQCRAADENINEAEEKENILEEWMQEYEKM